MFFKLTTELYCEKNCVKAHAADIAAFGSSALIVTGRNSSKENGSLDDVTDVLKEAGIDYKVFDEVEENPSIENIMKATLIGRKYKPDFVIGIGGGSPLDASKAISMMIANPDADESLLFDAEHTTYLPVVTVPTTCGTGSEITPYSIVTIHEKKTKSSLPHKIYPALALVDPSYLESAPASVIRNTAVDALGHLIESYIHSKSTDISRIFSEKGLSMWKDIALFIENDAYTYEQYEKLINASTIGGMAISHTGTSLPHRMSYYFTYNDGVPHGKAVGAFLASYVRHAPENDGRYVLDKLGMKDWHELGDLIRKITGTMELKESALPECISFILDNKIKLASCPYSVDHDIVEEIYRDSVVISK